MATKSETWQKRFGLATCKAEAIEKAIPATALGVAVIYEQGEVGETIFLVVESRAGSLRAQCEKRLQTAKLPPASALTVSFKADKLPDTSPETIKNACRQQVVFAGEIRRELKPAMR